MALHAIPRIVEHGYRGRHPDSRRAPRRPLLVPGLLRNNFDLIPKNVVEGRMCPRESFSLERAEDDRLDQLMSLTVFRKHHRYRISIPLPHNCGTYRWLVVQSVPLSSCALPLESRDGRAGE